STTFCSGVTLNDPLGTDAQQHAVLNLYKKAIDLTPVGGAIHLTTTKLDDQGLVDSLLAAQARGTFVQVVLRTTEPLTTGEQAVLAALGADTTGRTWGVQCT